MAKSNQQKTFKKGVFTMKIFETKNLIVLLIAGITLICFSAISGFAADKPIVLKFAHNDSATQQTVKHAGALAMKYFLEKESAGRFKVEIYPAGQLGGEKENVEGTMAGTIQMTAASDGGLSSFVPEMMSASVPYSVTSPAIMWEVLDNSKWSDDLKKIMLKRLGVRVLGYGEVGFRNFTNNVRPLRTPDDLKGIKFRTMQSPAHIKMIEALGGIAVPMDFTELYTALQVGTLDGQENPVVVINYAKLYEVQKHVTMDGHNFTAMWLIINEKFYNGLADDLKVVVKRGAKIATTVMRSTSQFIDVVGVDNLISKGMQVTYLTPEQIELFKNKSQEAVKDFIVGKIGKEWVNKFGEACKEAEERIAKEN